MKSRFSRYSGLILIPPLNANVRDDIDKSMMIQLDKVNPKFRQLTDLLFFSDRMDLDLSEFKQLLKENHDPHFDYLWDRFKKGTEIFWENGEQFWFDRLSFLLSLNEKTLAKYVEDYLQKRMFSTVRAKFSIDIKYDNEYLQFLQFCKVKHFRKESLVPVKNYLTEMPSHLSTDKLIKIVNSFIPIVFNDIDEYASIITKKITQSARHFDLLLALEQQGILFDKRPIIRLAFEIIVERAHNDKNRRAFFTIINDPTIRNGLKQIYNSSHHPKLMALISDCDYQIIEEHHLRNVKNLVDLDATVADEIAIIYADKLYHRSTGHKKANADRLIRLLKTIPQIMPKKILAYLSSNNKMSDIKYVLSAFPDLRKLAAFV